jgi:hypothetical protein
MPFYGQTWFLSIVSGLIAVLLYHVFGPPPPNSASPIHNSDAENPSDTDDKAPDHAQTNRSLHTKSYIGVFLTVAVLVYGSFLIAQSTGSCRLIDEQPDIQTGGRPPF